MITKNMREHDEAQRLAAEEYFLTNANKLPDEFRQLIEKAQEAARRYAWHELLRYSSEHPRRWCELRMGMGDCTLHVEYGGYIPSKGPWVFNEKEEISSYRHGMRGPDFLGKIQNLGEQLGFNRYDGGWFESGIWVAYHGVMIEGELT